MPEPLPQPLRFGAFELDESNARLTQEGRPVALPPKAFAVLCALVRQPNQLITKDGLLDAVWGHRHISESVLKSTISQVRAALADDPAQPRYIETVARRGYRFVGSLTAPASNAPALIAIPDETGAVENTGMIGRRAALSRLQTAWQSAGTGQRELVWIAGDPGIGKTTLIERFVGELQTGVVARGQCVEQFGAGEPYLPVLEALGSLCRRYPELPTMLRAIAPTWLLQLPWLSSEAERAALQRELAGTSQERMVREIIELFSRFTQQVPLLLVTEDLHWADHGTLRLMDYFARTREPLRLLWVGSFRLIQVIAEGHPLQALRQELRLHRLCSEVMLDPFSEEEVSEYLASRLPRAAIPEALVQRLHAHTDGLPLFVANVLETLREQEAAADWLQASLRSPLPIPENLTGAIERQIARLSEELQLLLQTASVCGTEFRSRIVGEVIGRDAPWVEERCDELLRRQLWVRHVAVVELSDGSLDTRYAFRHALYRSVFHQRIAPAARIQLHRRVALAMERGQVLGAAVAPAELAAQYESGMVHAAALRHYADAARHALGHFAPQEAVDLTGHALTLVPRCAAGVDRDELELALLSHRGIAMSQLQGMSDPQVQRIFDRVQTLCDSLPVTPARALILNGLGWMYFGRGDYASARSLGQRVEELSVTYNDPVLHVCACNLMGTTLMMHADYVAAREWLEAGLATCEQLGDRLPDAIFVIQPSIIMRATLAVPLFHLGFPDRARAYMEDALARAERLGQPMARMVVTWNLSMFEIRMQRTERVATLVETLQQLVERFGLSNGEGPSRWIHGWVEVQRGQAIAGHRRMLEGFAFYRHVGVFARAESMSYAAEALLLAGDWQGAQVHLDEARELVRRFGERIYLPDLLLLQARCLLAQGQIAAAREQLQQLQAEARAQRSQWHELRALVQLCELEAVAADDVASLEVLLQQLVEGADSEMSKRARALVAAHRRLG